MKIKTRLTLLFSFIFGFILLVFIIGVYHFYSNRCHNDYFDRLHIRAAIKVDLIDGETIAPEIFHLLYENAPKDFEPQVSIFHLDGKLVYHDKKNPLPQEEVKAIMEQVRVTGQVKTWHNEMQTFGFLIEGNKGDYIVIATGYDINGYEQLRSLKATLSVAYMITMCCIVLALRLFIKQALNPVAQMTEKVQDINASRHLDIRLDEGNRKDELAELAITFNCMLSQLETAFDAQKQFVYNISHELRTPLSAIITELELAKSGSCDKQKYEKAIDLALQDAHRLTKLSTNLLDMAKANYSPSEIGMHKVRLDELLLEVCCKLQKNVPECSSHIIFDKEDLEDERFITVNGNPYLLSVAFGNLIDNGCKFSPDKTCEVHISYEGAKTIIQITDHGIGIAEEDHQLIFTPFFRGSNKNFAEGNGIGLSLTHKIIEIHSGSIQLDSYPGHTTFTVSLPNLA